jgi:hypothetical protein
MERGKWVRLAVVLFLALLCVAVASVVYVGVSTVREEISRGLVVYYRPSLPFTSPYMFVGFVNESGHGLDVCVSVYGLMPNGSVGFLGYTCGRGGVSLDYGSVKSYASSWRLALAARGNNPDNVEPGLMLLGTALDSEATYPFIKGIPIDTGLVQKGYTATTEIKLNTRNMPKISKTQIQQIVTQAKQNTASAQVSTVATQQRPPGGITDYCWSFSDGSRGCFEWRLDKVIYSSTNRGIPLAMAYVTGNLAKLGSVFLKEKVVAQTSIGLYVNFAAGAELEVKSGATISHVFSSDVYTFTLGGNNVYLDYSNLIYPEQFSNLPFITAIGFWGNYSIIRYKEYYCIYSSFVQCYPTGDNATMALAVPMLSNNKMLSRSYTDTYPYDGFGLDPVFNVVANSWTPTGYRTSTSYLDFDSYDIVRETGGIDLLSASIPLLVQAPVSTSISASVGLSTQTSSFTMTDVLLQLKYQYTDGSTTLNGYYYKTPVKYEWNNNYYYIPASYVRATVGP